MVKNTREIGTNIVVQLLEAVEGRILLEILN
jgi:hypothetical protein